MKNVWKKHNKITIILFLNILILTIGLMIYTVLSMANYTKAQTEALVVDIKKSYMKETIDNLIIRIETTEDDILTMMDAHIDSIALTIEQNATEHMDVEYLKNTIHQHSHDSHQVDALIYDRLSGALLYQNVQSTDSQISMIDQMEAAINTSATSKEIQVGQYTILLYVAWDDIYQMNKAKAYDEIHRMHYGNNQYVWVNEVLDYDGGDDYAIRLIRPNLQKSEGEYLSTAMQDIDGKFPYLMELNGVKEHGEMTQYYHFKKLDSDEIGEKISYARLYEKYDWIIATGIPTEDLDLLVNDIDNNSRSFIIKNTLMTIIIFSGGLLVALYYLVQKQREYLSSLECIVKKETEIDLLTGAFSGKYGNDFMEEKFDHFKKTGTNAAVFILDLDNFKAVNDTYGHAVGDIVLQKATKKVLNIIRYKDCFSRWGGEEFVLIMDGMTAIQAEAKANNIVKQIAEIEFEGNDTKFNISVSIGGSLFLESDSKYQDALQRADAALYFVKRNGKNAARFDVQITEATSPDLE